jgi:hypothetical protein
MHLVLIIIVVAAVIAGMAYGAYAAKQRREAMASLAAGLGLRFSPDNDSDMAERYGFLDRLSQGSNRYAFNTLSGRYKENEVCIFDYHYETHSTDSKGHRHTHHHYFSFFILRLPRAFPELTIVREGLLSKIAQTFGYDDIDFESHEFSSLFCVRSRDKRFAYDVCNARMIEYLLANRDISIEIEREALALAFDKRLAPEAIATNLDRLIEIRSRLPPYLMEGA